MTTDAELQRAIRDLLQRDLQEEARDFLQLKGGRNSRVFRVECGAGRVFAAKAYFQSESDRRLPMREQGSCYDISTDMFG